MRFLGRTTLALTLLVAVLTPAQIASAADPHDRKLLAKPSHGREAIRALGENVDEAAAINGRTVADFKRAVSEDPTLWVGREGRLFYQESAAGLTGSSAPEVQTASADLADTFLLHSRDGSDHVIYLDFGGMTITSTSWWVTDGGMSARTATGYSQDADPAFNDTEKTYIQQVWRIVAERFAGFDVDVTTEDPGAAAYNRTSAGDTTWGDRVVISSDDAAMADACGCPGTAFIGTFDGVDSGQAEPTWVFTDPLGSSAALAANAASHEIGHTFGLDHDGPGSNGYYSGHNQWVPVMGVTTSRPVVQFSKGEYTTATNHEDDLAIIAAGGAPLLPDEEDDGGTIGTATPLPSPYTTTGIIRSAADKDVFSVDGADCDDLTATATGIGTGQTVDLKVTVYDAAGDLVGADDPASYHVGATAFNMDADYTVSPTLDATYYVEVDGVGSGGLGNTPNPDTGYTDYGSVGQYTLTITGCASASDPPTVPQSLVANPILRSTNGSVSWSAPASVGDGPVTGYTVTGLPGGTANLGPSARSASSTSLVAGQTYPVSVVATNAYGDSPAATVNLKVPTWAPTAAPSVFASVTGKDVTATWGTVANPGGATLTGWTVVLKRGTTLVNGATVPLSPRSITYDDLAPGSYTVTVTVNATAEDTAGRTAGSASFEIPADKPSAPVIGTPSFGTKGGAITAITRWGAPSSDGGSPITGYRVVAYKLTAANNISKVFYSKVLPSSARSLKWTTLPAGRYKFRVVAYNVAGTSPYSAFSTNVLAQ